MESPLGSRARCVVTLAVVAAAFSAASTRAQTTVLVSVATGGTLASSSSNGPSSSFNGRVIAFGSFASNLVVGDANGVNDIFVRNRINGVTECVSVSTSGVPGDAFSQAPSISADGRLVAFWSAASNLVAGDTNIVADIFVRDCANGTTERVNVDSNGAQANSDSGNFPWVSISGGGRYVAFASKANNLVAGDTNAFIDVFVRDRQNSTTECVSLDSGGAQGNGHGYMPSISTDGRFIAFTSRASNLVSGDTNGADDIFLRDRQNSTTTRISVSTSGTQANSVSLLPSISADGRFVAYSSFASNLVPNDTNTAYDIFVRDRVNATTERVSASTGGVQSNATSGLPVISADGRFVAFYSEASNLVVGDTNGTFDIFVRDRANGTTERASVAANGAQGSSGNFDSAISGDGNCVVFGSYATNLVVGDTNGFYDLFVRERAQIPSVYCTSSTSTNGCSASIAASANPSVSFAHACNLSVTNVEGLKFGILFYGVDNSGFSNVTWGPGSTSLRCVKYPVQRTPLQNSGGTFAACNGSYALDWNAYQSANPVALGNPWTSGAQVCAQAWFRDPPAVKSTNLSNAVEMIYVP